MARCFPESLWSPAAVGKPLRDAPPSWWSLLAVPPRQCTSLGVSKEGDEGLVGTPTRRTPGIPLVHYSTTTTTVSAGMLSFPAMFPCDPVQAGLCVRGRLDVELAGNLTQDVGSFQTELPASGIECPGDQVRFQARQQDSQSRTLRRETNSSPCHGSIGTMTHGLNAK